MKPNKKDIISHVYGAIMHLLHESCLYGSDLWPKKGFLPGYGIGCTKSDTVAIGVSISHNDERAVWVYHITMNVLNRNSKRAIDQALLIDMIMDNALQDDVYFESSRLHWMTDKQYYDTKEWWGYQMKYVQIGFQFIYKK